MKRQTLFFAVIMGILSFFACNSKAPEKMKTIKYRGGLVEFRIPASWKEEYEQQDGGTFYEDRPDSATLRLNVITAQSPNPITESSVTELLEAKGKTKGKAAKLENGNAMLRYTESATEQGHSLKITYWQVANPVPPNHVRIGIFSYTILESQQEKEKFKKEIELLDTEIRNAQFAKQLGI